MLVFCPPPCYFGPENKGGGQNTKGGAKHQIRDLKIFFACGGPKTSFLNVSDMPRKLCFEIRFFSAKRIDVDASVANKISFHGCRKRPLSLVK